MSPRRPRIVSLRPPNRTRAPVKASTANDTRPEPGWPPIACAANIAPPMTTANSGRNQRDLHMVLIEHLLHCGLEIPREREGQRQRGRVALLLDRVDRLARHVQVGRKLALGQPPEGPQFSHGVSHLL